MEAESIAEQSPTIALQRSRGIGRLQVKSVGNSTQVSDLYQEGCAKLRLPKSQTGAMQAVMINSSGGMTGGDRLEWSFGLEANTALSVTTQACERIYAASGDTAHANVKIDVAQDAKLAWLPQETIVFDQGRYSRNIDVDLAGTAEFLMVEPLVFGRGAMEERVQNGLFKDRWRIRQAGRLLHAEDAAFDGKIDAILANPAVSGGSIAMATLLLVAPRSEGLVKGAREIIGDAGGVSFWNGKLLARIISEDSYSLRKTLVPLIGLLNKNAPLPKIWAL